MNALQALIPFVPSPPATSATTREGDRTVVRLWGELDTSSVEVLSGVLAAATEMSGDDVVVDLQGVTFVDASALHALAFAMNALRLGQRKMTLRRPCRAVDRVMRLTHAIPASAVERLDGEEGMRASA